MNFTVIRVLKTVLYQYGIMTVLRGFSFLRVPCHYCGVHNSRKLIEGGIEYPQTDTCVEYAVVV